MIEYLNFLDTTIMFDIDDDALSAFAGVRRFFRHILHQVPSATPTFSFAVRAYEPHEVPEGVWSTEQSIIRRSSAREFNFDAHIVEQVGRRLYINRDTYVDTPRDAAFDPRFELRVTPESTIQVIDLVRDLIIRHEESLGTVVLHAAGAASGESALMIAGPKGAGKTTALLSLLRRHREWSYFTGDKVFCRLVEGGVDVYPWRDFPYIGVGTILADGRLSDLIRREVDPQFDRRGPTEKLLVDPDVFESWLGSPFGAAPKRLAAILLPTVRPGRPTRTWAVTDPNERWAQLNKIIDRQADTTFFTWQSYLVPDYTSFFASLNRLRNHLEDIALVRLEGTVDVDPEIILGQSRKTGSTV